MKITVENAPSSQEIKFPCLMISEIGQIVLFIDVGIGILLQSGESPCPIGDWSKQWYMGGFKPFTGKIVLEND